MLMRSANRHIVAVTFSVVLFGSPCSPREVHMRQQQSVRSVPAFQGSLKPGSAKTPLTGHQFFSVGKQTKQASDRLVPRLLDLP
jgi:hypothetical protein